MNDGLPGVPVACDPPKNAPSVGGDIAGDAMIFDVPDAFVSLSVAASGLLVSWSLNSAMHTEKAFDVPFVISTVIDPVVTDVAVHIVICCVPVIATRSVHV